MFELNYCMLFEVFIVLCVDVFILNGYIRLVGEVCRGV